MEVCRYQRWKATLDEKEIKNDRFEVMTRSSDSKWDLITGLDCWDLDAEPSDLFRKLGERNQAVTCIELRN
jgi:hypothetical protein